MSRTHEVDFFNAIPSGLRVQFRPVYAALSEFARFGRIIQAEDGILRMNALRLCTAKNAAQCLLNIYTNRQTEITITEVDERCFTFIRELCALMRTLYVVTLHTRSSMLEVGTDTPERITYETHPVRISLLIREITSILVPNRRIRVVAHMNQGMCIRTCGETIAHRQTRESCNQVIHQISTLVNDGRCDIPVGVQEMLTNALSHMALAVAAAKNGIY